MRRFATTWRRAYDEAMPLFGRETTDDRARAEAWAAWARQQNVFAIVSLVLGIFSLIEFGVLGVSGVAGIVCGVIALRHGRSRAIAWTGIVLSVASLLLAVAIYARLLG